MFTTKLSTSNFKMIFFSFRLLSPLQLLRVYAHTQLNWLLNIYIRISSFFFIPFIPLKFRFSIDLFATVNDLMWCACSDMVVCACDEDEMDTLSL